MDDCSISIRLNSTTGTVFDLTMHHRCIKLQGTAPIIFLNKDESIMTLRFQLDRTWAGKDEAIQVSAKPAYGAFDNQKMEVKCLCG